MPQTHFSIQHFPRKLEIYSKKMKNSRRTGDRTWLVCCFVLAFLLMFCHTYAEDGVLKKVTDPTSNVNLTPFEQWLSAYECLLNVSKNCPVKYQLSEKGWVNVTLSDTDEYCYSGCAADTGAVLMCVYLVKRDYKFMDSNTVDSINNTITTGCKQGFTGSALPVSSAKRFPLSKSAIFSSMAALLMVSYM